MTDRPASSFSGSRSDIVICSGLVLGVVLVYGFLVWQVFSAVRAEGGTPDSYITFASDSQEYVGLAQTMLSTHRFAIAPDAPPDGFRTPVYPAFIAAVLYLSGSFEVLVAIQILLAALSCVLVYLIGARYFSRGIGLFAAVVFALDPSVVNLALVALSETLYIFLFLLSVFLIGRGEGKWRVPLLVLSGVFAALSALTRPIGLFIIPFIVLLAALYPQQQIRRAALSAGVVILAAALTLSPWILRNGLVAGGWGLSSITGYNALFFNAEQFQVYETGKSAVALTAEYHAQLDTSDFTVLSSFAYAAREKKMAEQIIFPHIVSYAYFHIAKTAPFFLSSSIEQVEESSSFPFSGLRRGPSTVNISGLLLSGNVRAALSALTSDPLVLIERFFWLFVTVLAFWYPFGALYARSPRWRVALVWFLIVGTFAILTGPVAAARYRVPAEPFLLMLAGAGFAAIIGWIRSRLPSYERN